MDVVDTALHQPVNEGECIADAQRSLVGFLRRDAVADEEGADDLFDFCFGEGMAFQFAVVEGAGRGFQGAGADDPAIRRKARHGLVAGMEDLQDGAVRRRPLRLQRGGAGSG